MDYFDQHWNRLLLRSEKSQIPAVSDTVCYFLAGSEFVRLTNRLGSPELYPNKGRTKSNEQHGTVMTWWSRRNGEFANSIIRHFLFSSLSLSPSNNKPKTQNFEWNVEDLHKCRQQAFTSSEKCSAARWGERDSEESTAAAQHKKKSEASSS